MKKITLALLVMLAFCWQSNAQFTESFETEIPATWTVLDLASASSWVWDDTPSGAGGAQDGNAVARIIYDGSTAHDDYLITPQITVASGVNDRLSFYVQSRSGTFLESYEVLLSTATATAADFTVVLQAESDAPTAWTQLSFDLSAYDGQSVYVAIRATGLNEFELYADNFVNDTAPTDTLDYLNLQWPPTLTFAENELTDQFVYAQAYEAGLTDATMGQAPGIEAWIGYSSADTDPSGAGWTWEVATFNTEVGNNDEYALAMQSLGLTEGTYYYASRFSLNGGPFGYGGILADGSNGGAWDGTTNISGVLTVTAPVPPVNVDCANAITIACDETINATSVASTGTSEDVGCAMGDNGIWYTFVGTGGDMTISVDASFDHRIGLASGSCGALVNIVCDDQSIGNESHTFASTLNETYYAYIAHYDSGNTTTGTVDITLTCAVIPACTPAVIDSSTVVDNCNPDATGTFTVDIVVSDTGDAGSVFDDGTTTYPVVVGTVTAGPYNSGDSVTIELTALDTDCSSTVGTFEFTCTLPPPANDECAGAIELNCADSITGTTINATGAGGASSCNGSIGNNVWYKITGDGSEVNLALVASNEGAQIGVYESTDGTCAGFTEGTCVASVDDLGALDTELSFQTTIGTEYYINIGAWISSGDDFTFDLDVTCLNCVAPTVTIPADPIDNTNCPATVDVSISIDDLGDSASLTISAEDDMGNPIGTGGTVSATGVFTITDIPVPQTDLSIIIAHESDTGCDVVLGPFVLDCPPANDLFADAIAVACGDSVMGTTLYATQDEADAPDVATVEDDTDADNDSPWVWYSYDSSVSGAQVVTLSTCGVANTDFDTELFVYTGTSGSLTLIDDGYDECGGSAENYAAETSFTSDGTTTYYIAVGGYNVGNQGNFQLNVTCVEPCTADAGTLTADATPVELTGGTATISATPNGDIVVPTDYDVTYVLTSGAGLVIEAAGATPSFDVTAVGDYTIHTLVAETSDSMDPNYLDLSVIVFGTTTGGDVLGIVTAAGLCASLDVTGAPITVEDLLGIDDENIAAFTYFPNPVKNTLRFNAQNIIENVTVFNMLGQEVITANPKAIDSELDMSSLESGAYFVKVTISNVTKTVRVIKE